MGHQIEKSLASSQGASLVVIMLRCKKAKKWNTISDKIKRKRILQKRNRSFLSNQKNCFVDSYSPLGSFETNIQTILFLLIFEKKNKYTRTFGRTQFELEKCAIVFASCESYTRLPSAYNKSPTCSQSHQPPTTFQQNIACFFVN